MFDRHEEPIFRRRGLKVPAFTGPDRSGDAKRNSPMGSMAFFGPRITHVDIAAAEKELEFKLPTTLSAFLLECNGGKPSRGFFPIQNMDFPWGHINYVYGIKTGSDDTEIVLWHKILSRFIPEGWLSFAITDNEDQILMSIEGRPEIMFWDTCSKAKTPEKAMFKISSSFREFCKVVATNPSSFVDER